MLVESKSNHVWSGPMIVIHTSARLQYNVVVCFNFKVFGRGSEGGFKESDLKIVGSLTKLEKLIYGVE